MTGDLAFLCKQNVDNRSAALENWINKDNKPIIGINVHKDFKSYNNLVVTEIRQFITNFNKKYRFLFIPHDSRKNEYEDLRDLQSSCNDIDGYITTYLDPEYENI